MYPIVQINTLVAGQDYILAPIPTRYYGKDCTCILTPAKEDEPLQYRSEVLTQSARCDARNNRACEHVRLDGAINALPTEATSNYSPGREFDVNWASVSWRFCNYLPTCGYAAWAPDVDYTQYLPSIIADGRRFSLLGVGFESQSTVSIDWGCRGSIKLVVSWTRVKGQLRVLVDEYVVGDYPGPVTNYWKGTAFYSTVYTFTLSKSDRGIPYWVPGTITTAGHAELMYGYQPQNFVLSKVDVNPPVGPCAVFWRYEGQPVGQVLEPRLDILTLDIQAAVSKAIWPENENSKWSELMTDAIHNSTFIDNNMSMFVRDIVCMHGDFQSLYDAGVKLGNTVRTLSRADVSVLANRAKMLGASRDVANVYLPLLYGYGLTFDEALGIGEKLDELRTHWQDIYHWRPARAGTHMQIETEFFNLDARLSYAAWIRPEDTTFSKLYALMQNTGFQLSLQDAWDWIPYSFCVDWVVGIGDFLDAIDTVGWQANYLLQTVVKSVKAKIQDLDAARYFPGKFRIYGDLSGKYYHRWSEDHFDRPPFLLEFKKDWLNNLFDHSPEGAALIIQRLS